ncbi:hypothetical protein O6H91_03G061200 [Diphasiastrum complanatum]|uniref:Uncharacterized protein n=1 Tax=Diphasiastrum complanatum TaxID=34168 RepID=A0ACC2E725_DIPCM|nr:hypothetical protein O6H91_03G061200 [Diphasiastrum complanatum]
MEHFTYCHNNQGFASPRSRIFHSIFNRVSRSLFICHRSCSVRRSAKLSVAIWSQPGINIQSRFCESIRKGDSFKKRAMSSEDREADASKSSNEFLEVANRLADAAAEITLKYFRTPIDIIDKLDKSPVTVADQAAEKAMRLIIAQHFPSHAIYGEEGGLSSPEYATEYTWVLDPIDGTKSFITGKPLFGTLIALVQGGIPILGIIDQPVLKERWIGQRGQPTTLNGKEVKTRSCTSLSNGYMYTTSPHLFAGQAEAAYERLRKKVKVPLYGCDCYAYGLLAAGHVDLVVESGLKLRMLALACTV